MQLATLAWKIGWDLAVDIVVVAELFPANEDEFRLRRLQRKRDDDNGKEIDADPELVYYAPTVDQWPMVNSNASWNSGSLADWIDTDVCVNIKRIGWTTKLFFIMIALNTR